MRLFTKPVERWKHRNDWLICPACSCKPTLETFAKGRYLLNDESLQCDHCQQVNQVRFWRARGLPAYVLREGTLILEGNKPKTTKKILKAERVKAPE